MSQIYHVITKKGNYVQLLEGNGLFVIKRNNHEVLNCDFKGDAYRFYNIIADDREVTL